jgi:tetratricopeptide (TPR) repeat protein
LKRYDLALGDFQKAVELDVNHASAHNSIAWICATHPDAKLRDGMLALKHALKACELMPEDAQVLDTLAAAYAEAGDFDAAVQTQRKAIELLDDEESQENFQARLKHYESQQPYRDLKADR